ncbi:MAG: mandelate racemase/muconate lactonizing enzyme family protein [candidate division NC10 bacterium]|nr:mandelate racemase/muconate lactonizing enzyme family protein [candidate division NC10 bacterium]
MRISDVEVVLLKKILAKPLVLSRGEVRERRFAFVLVHTDEGITGLGEGVGDPHLIQAMVERRLKPILVGEDPFDVERLWRRMFAGAVYWDLKGALLTAISGVDIALWDLKAKALGVPAYQLLGGASKEKISAYASDLFWDDPAAMAEAAAKSVADGFSVVKTHIGKDPEGDLARARAIRRAIGDQAGFMIDINCHFDRPTALWMGKRFREVNPFWYEEPLPPYDLEGYRELKDRLDLPIAAGENEFTKYGFLELFQRRAVDYAMPDIARIGGLTEAVKVCALAEAFNVPCSPHNFSSGVLLAATLHLMAALPGTDLLEFDVTGTSVYEELFVEPLLVQDGFVSIPHGVGLGVELTEEVRRRYAL